MRILTAAWGDAFVDLMEMGLLRSLSWPQNRSEVSGAHWTIVTREADIPRLEHLLKAVDPAHTRFVKIQDNDPWLIFYHILISEIETCIQQNEVFFFALPDHIWSEGSVPNCLELTKAPGVCVSVANVRVLDTFLPALHRPITSAEMVSLSWRHLHATWKNSELGQPLTNCFASGIAWRRTPSGLIAVTHRLPSPFFCRFIPSDHTWFKQQNGFPVWDRIWPRKLIGEGRQRYVGSSDLAFMAEITEEDTHCTYVETSNTVDPDGFHDGAPHFEINRCFTAVFRGDT